MSQSAKPLGLDSDPLGFLVAPQDGAAFLAQHWERGPVVVKATPERRAFFEGLASFGALARLARCADEEGEPLEFGVDVNAARYVDGKRETPNGEVADCATLDRLYHNEGCTMQFHQPQRFSDDFWRLLAALERQLGCLVGANTYLTPPGTQGLAPHWDDVEIFVVQTQGSKRWRLHVPPPAPAGSPAGGRAQLLSACRLANAVSGDLEKGELGAAVQDFTLEVGDVLYMPRGTIHQACAQDQGSAHLTISTYQRWSAADLLQYTVSVALANHTLQPLLPAPLKAGLPHRWLADAALGAGGAATLAAAAGGFREWDAGAAAAAAAGKGSSKAAKPGGKAGGGGATAGLAKQLASACRSLAECLEGEGELAPRLLQTAADTMAEDFMRSRLPPHPTQLPPRGPAPTLQDSVQCVGAGLFRLVPFHPKQGGGCAPDCDEDHEHGHGHAEHEHGHACDDEDSDEEHEEGHGHGHEGGGGGAAAFGAPPACVRLVSCLHNERMAHMMSGGGEEEGQSGSDDDSGSDGESDEDAAALAAAAGVAAAPARKRKHPAADDGSGSSSEGEDGEDDGEEEGNDEEGSEEEGDEGTPEDLVFPAEFAPALVQLLDSAADAPGGGGAPLPVATIALPDPELQLQVAAVLWDAGVLRTVKATAPAKVPKAKPAKASKESGKTSKGEAAAAPVCHSATPCLVLPDGVATI
ncbi:bifunctional lysine-specific demethylase and histidyl-hydroxylase MINA [Micractinium conductrix]|uniref:Bifunctional lysine-specific demethylase and histidyl-hydroxylase n=1 Tax=Micractinium conductrix TaxID=554055 RepID=A0A2P6VKD6_9CHLO|nr:bifunctional lysine-specific demethylase and histidyl-hydroxylase MINA [Micractinium conductrix]|eukprot:PSC74527.1 bifunctional lysine-specific demethylase and histidyl-hydroxylase MINA [Micractinium conductrix]